MNYNIKNEIDNQLYDAINSIIDEYLNGYTFGTRHAREVLTKSDFDLYFNGLKPSLKDAKKNFNTNKNLMSLIKDIKYTGYQLYKTQFLNLYKNDESTLDNNYKELVKKILNKIIDDRMAHEKDKNKNTILENIKSFEDFNLITEMKLPIFKLDELLDDVSIVSNKILKTILVTFFKTYLDYIDLIDNKKHIFRINDMKGDILNNNRSNFDAIIFNSSDIQIIKKNIIDYSIGEFYSSLPDTVDVFGITMKTSSFINKDELNQVFEGQITDQFTIDTISSITNFNYIDKFNDFYIWSTQITNMNL